MASSAYAMSGSRALALRAVKDAFYKLHPKEQANNPVMLMVFISAAMTTVLFILSLVGISDSHPGNIFAIAVILWLTVLFANFAEAWPRAAARRRPTVCVPPRRT